MTRRGFAPRPAEERFCAKYRIDSVTGCWLWTGFIKSNGYGTFLPQRTVCVNAHRYSYELHIGPVPEGLQLDHLCRVRHCVNPAHLEPVTASENQRRGRDSRPPRSHCKRGHVLSEDNVYVHRGARICRTCIRASRRRLNDSLPQPTCRRCGATLSHPCGSPAGEYRCLQCDRLVDALNARNGGR